MRISVLAVVLLIVGCASRAPLQTRDIPVQQATWMEGRRTESDGTKLKLVFERDPLTSIKRVDYKVRDGELYIWPVHGSEKFQPIVFTLDTAKLKINEPWQEHVYWVETAHWDGGLGRLVDFDPLGDRVDRVKADVKR